MTSIIEGSSRIHPLLNNINDSLDLLSLLPRLRHVFVVAAPSKYREELSQLPVMPPVDAYSIRIGRGNAVSPVLYIVIKSCHQGSFEAYTSAPTLQQALLLVR